MEQQYPRNYLYNLQFPGFWSNHQPETISTKLQEALVPPVRLFTALHFVLWEARGKIFMDMWDLVYKALKSGHWSIATKGELHTALSILTLYSLRLCKAAAWPPYHWHATTVLGPQETTSLHVSCVHMRNVP